MTKNPFLNASAAFLYIVALVALITYGLSCVGDSDMIAPIVFLCLLVLSVLMMGYTLLLAPLELFFEKEIRAGTVLFSQTLGIFGLITVVLVAVLMMLF